MRKTILFLLTLIFVALAAPSKQVHRRIACQLNRRASQDVSQTSLTLDKSQVQPALEKDGQQNATDGQVPSLTSINNFINFCLTQKDVPLTNGAQMKRGSCNPTVMGRIIAQTVMPTSKFLFPSNLDNSIRENQTFTVKLAVKNIQTGNFVNPDTNYFAAPVQVNDKGQLIGHSHLVIQAISSLNSTDILDPTQFVFFQGLNAKATNGILSAKIAKGLPAGMYRMGSITTAANHQPALVSVAQHGMLDDIVYFTVNEAQMNHDSVATRSSGNPKEANQRPGTTKTDPPVKSS